MAVNNLNTPGVGIQPSLIDAKGDLLVGTANDAIDRLGVTGTTGAVLTADAGETTGLKWAAAGSVGGLVHIEQQTFTASSGVNFSQDVFTSTFDNYKLLINCTATASVAVRLRGRVTGSPVSTSDYNEQLLLAEAGSVSGVRNTGQTGYRIGQINTTGLNSILVEIFAPKLTSPTRFISNCSHSLSQASIEITAGNLNLTTNLDSLEFFPGSGNITGTAALYGYRK
jgi:hypothetical protein